MKARRTELRALTASLAQPYHEGTTTAGRRTRAVGAGRSTVRDGNGVTVQTSAQSSHLYKRNRGLPPISIREPPWQNGQGDNSGVSRTFTWSSYIKTIATSKRRLFSPFSIVCPQRTPSRRALSPAEKNSHKVMSRPHFLQPLLRSTRGAPAVWNGRTDRAVATRVATAFDSAERRRGLLGRDGLGPDEALVIAPTNLIHTFGMRFPIDLLFVARDGRVLKVRRAVPPRRIAGALRAFAVIELAAGSLESSGTRAGDVVEIRS